MEKEYRAQKFLQEVCPIVPATKVTELMQQDGTEFLACQFAQSPFRHQHRGTQETHSSGSGDLIGDTDARNARGGEFLQYRPSFAWQLRMADLTRAPPQAAQAQQANVDSKKPK